MSSQAGREGGQRGLELEARTWARYAENSGRSEAVRTSGRIQRRGIFKPSSPSSLSFPFLFSSLALFAFCTSTPNIDLIFMVSSANRIKKQGLDQV